MRPSSPEELTPNDQAIERDRRIIKKYGRFAVAFAVISLLGGYRVIQHENNEGWSLPTLNEPANLVNGFALGIGLGGVLASGLVVREVRSDLRYRQEMQSRKDELDGED